MDRRNWLRTAGAAGALALVNGADAALALGSKRPRMVIYKSPSCGCCGKWVDHVKANGFDTVVRDTDNVGGIKQNHGLPAELASCHTALVGGYVIEGHVPADLIHKLLKQKPKVTGLAVPGMPQGSPGMETGIKDKYNVIAWKRGGPSYTYATR